MKRVLIWLGRGLAALLGVTLLVAGAAYARGVAKANHHWAVQPAPVVVPTDEASIAEGTRLFSARGCKKCHGADAGGVLVLDLPLLGTMYGANLTRGEGSATRDYGPVDWVRTVRHGIKPSGLPLQVMDANEYQHLSDRDLGLIVAAIGAMPPVDRVNPPMRIQPLAYVFHGLGMLDVTSADRVDHARPHTEDPAASASADFGEYIVRLQCRECHGHQLSGGTLSGAPGLAVPLNLTPDDETGLGRWSYADFVTAMRTGKRPDGRTLDSLMPWDTYATLSDDELTAIWSYLRRQPARPFGGR